MPLGIGYAFLFQKPSERPRRKKVKACESFRFPPFEAATKAATKVKVLHDDKKAFCRKRRKASHPKLSPYHKSSGWTINLAEKTTTYRDLFFRLLF